MFPQSCSRSPPGSPREFWVTRLSKRQLHLRKVPLKMFAVLHRYALDSVLLVLNSDFLLLTFLGQLHPRDSLPKTFFVSFQVKYVGRNDSQLALISVSYSALVVSVE